MEVFNVGNIVRFNPGQFEAWYDPNLHGKNLTEKASYEIKYVYDVPENVQLVGIPFTVATQRLSLVTTFPENKKKE